MNMQTATAKPLMSERRVGLLGALFAAIGPVSMSLYTPAMPEIVTAFGTTDAAVLETTGQPDDEDEEEGDADQNQPNLQPAAGAAAALSRPVGRARRSGRTM